MSSRNDYWAYLQKEPEDLMHYGVKGMKWGVRHDYVPTGRYRFIHRRPASDTRTSGSRPSHSSHVSSSPQQRRSRNRKKVLKGAAITAGTILAAAGATKLGLALRTESGRRMISNGKRVLGNKYYDYSSRARNVAKLTKQVVGTPMRAAKATPVGRVATNVVSAPKRLIGGTRAGKMALKAYGTAVVVSDINSTQKWVRKVHNQGKVTKSDVKDLAVNMINPLPDDLPWINKEAREKRKNKKNQNGG